MSEEGSPAPASTAKPASKVATTETKKPSSRAAAAKKATAAKKEKAAAKPKATTTKSTTTKASKSKTPAGHPSWKDIVKECIAANKEDSRIGVSRSTIKKFAEEQYKNKFNASNLNH
ncbi:hypothetical protein MPER_06485, partial [Moniliophthora perniciosa FA553]